MLARDGYLLLSWWRGSAANVDHAYCKGCALLQSTLYSAFCSLVIVYVMSFPLECVGPVCDAFFLRTKDLLTALEQNPSCPLNHGLVTRAKFSILTLNLMVQKNCDAVLYICQTLAKPDNAFFKVTFTFLLSSKYFSVITEMPRLANTDEGHFLLIPTL